MRNGAPAHPHVDSVSERVAMQHAGKRQPQIQQ